MSQAAWAAYAIDFESRISDAKPVLGKVILNEGEMGAVTTEGTTLQFVVTQTKPGAVKIQAEFLEKTKDGYRTVSKPTVVVLENQTAEISQQEKGSAKIYHLKLTPRTL